jgi:cysteine desulfurase/selenocysteine lyase
MINYKKRFSFFNKNKDIIYLDSANTSLKLTSVIKRETDFLSNNGASSHSFGYKLVDESYALVEETRGLLSNYLNVEPNNIIFTTGATQALNYAILGLESILNEGDEIITSVLDHHSVILPMRKLATDKNLVLKYIKVDQNKNELDINQFISLITPKTKLIFLTYISNAFGFKSPIDEIIKVARENNIIVGIDAAQAIPHIRIDCKALDCDFLAFSGHKIFGDFGCGALYIKSPLYDVINPVIYGGGTVVSVSYDDIVYKDYFDKFEAGTPNVSALIGLYESIKFLSEIDLEKVEKEITSYAKYCIKELKSNEDVIIYNNGECGIVNFNIRGVHPHDVQTYLASSNICVRAGHHCAMMALNALGIDSSVRVSFSIYNNKKEAIILVKQINECVLFFLKRSGNGS